MPDKPVLVLVHSPLLGPSMWKWVARELHDHGRSAVVPALPALAAVPSPLCRHICAEANRASQPAESVVVVGHSAAGTLLPAVAESLSAEVAGMVFVDTFLPPSGGAASLVPAEFIAELRARATDDVLPPWSTWFGESAMQDLVPDPARRAEVERDIPAMRLSSLLEPVPMPQHWERRACAYIRLSAEPYATSAAEARARGWPVAEIPGGKHLDPVRRPGDVVAALLDVERTLLHRG
jgi:pimeloyl-ACP methyl ester carboxylesterase